MEPYKHVPPNQFTGVTWTHVKDWVTKELGQDWDHLQQYHKLKDYNNTFFPLGAKTPPKSDFVKPPLERTIRYLNRV